MRALLAVLAALAVHGALTAAGFGPRARAANSIYVSTTSGGLPSYTQEAAGPGSTLYLVISEPALRPKQPRQDSLRLTPRGAASRAYDGVVDPSIRNLVAAASRAYDVPSALLLAVMHAESRFDPAARSAVGAIGLMQIMPPTGARYGVHRGLADPLNNIDVGARYLRDLLDLFKGDKALAVAAYNAGEGAVLRHGGRIPPYPETRAYVPRVLKLYDAYSTAVRRPEPAASMNQSLKR